MSTDQVIRIKCGSMMIRGCNLSIQFKDKTGIISTLIVILQDHLLNSHRPIFKSFPEAAADAGDWNPKSRRGRREETK